MNRIIKCVGPYDCEFDEDKMCHWINDPTNSNGFNWIRSSGNTPSGSTGPSADHTSGSGTHMRSTGFSFILHFIVLASFKIYLSTTGYRIRSLPVEALIVQVEEQTVSIKQTIQALINVSAVSFIFELLLICFSALRNSFFNS